MEDIVGEGWTIYNKNGGIYYNTFGRTRKETIQQHTKEKGRPWKKCRSNGDRIARAEIRIIEDFGDQEDKE